MKVQKVIDKDNKHKKGKKYKISKGTKHKKGKKCKKGKDNKHKKGNIDRCRSCGNFRWSTSEHAGCVFRCKAIPYAIISEKDDEDLDVRVITDSTHCPYYRPITLTDRIGKYLEI